LWGTPTWQAAAQVFARPLAEHMYEAFLQDLDREKAQYPDDGFGVSQFVIRNRCRNRTAPNPLKVYANQVLPFTPGLTKDFWGLVTQIPFEAKANHKLYLDLYERHFPEARAVPYCSAKTLVRGKGFDPGYDLLVAYRQFIKNRYVRGALRRLNFWQRWASPATLVRRVISQVEAEHPDLNAPAVQHLKQTPGPSTPIDEAARRILFYWQAWRWVMEGKLTVRQKDPSLLKDSEAQVRGSA
jgi:hypothetical protein